MKMNHWGSRGKWLGWLACALALAIVASTAGAQTFRGTILGSVTDPTGASVPGAKVTVKNVDTGLTRTTDTADDGSYRVPELPIGTYTVTVEKSGFQASVTSGARVEVAGERRVDATLKPGDVATKIEVSGETLAQVETTSNVLGGAVEGKQVLDLPINGRDFTRLLIMVPGAAGEPHGGGDSPGSFGLFSVNGSRGRANDFLLDGTDMNDGYRNLPSINQGGVFGTPGTVLPIEAIAEVRVLSNGEAEYGRNSGSVVNIVTKSGTNDIHGSVFDYFRNTGLNARNFFNTKPNPKDVFHNNQFGFAAGGPFVKDRTFWFVNYEGQRERLGVTSLNAVPTLAQFQTAVGILPGGNMAACNTTILACVTGQGPGVVNPVILALFNKCNTSGGCSGNHNVWPLTTVSSARAFNDANSFIAKLDHSFSASQNFTVRYFRGTSSQSFPLGLAGGNNLPNTNTDSPIKAQLVSASYVAVFSSKVVNEMRFGWNEYDQDFLAEDRAVFGNPNASIGLNNGVTNARDFGLPTIRVSGFSSLGSARYSNPRGRRDTNWHFLNNISWKLTRHEYKFGYEFRHTGVNSFYDALFRGRLTFDGGATGDPLADFLSGQLSGGFASNLTARGNTNRLARQNNHAFYAQDSFRWRRDFTLNLGLRWDYFGPIHEDKGQLSIYDPAVGLVLKPKLYNRDLNNFSPRVSAAWDIGGKSKTVVRAGFGVYYDLFAQDFFTAQIPFNCFNCPGVSLNPIGPNPITFAAFPNVGVLASGTAIFPAVGLDTTDVFTVNALRTPYVYNYNLNVQQDLWGKGTLQVGYVGSGGRKLFRIRDIDQPSQAVINAADIACAGAGNTLGSAGCSVDGPRNFTTPLTGPTGAAPNAPFYINQLETSATSNYHGLQVTLQQRNWHGITQQVNYTWSHSLDTASDGQDFVPNASQPQDSTRPALDKGNSNFDVRNRFVWDWTYDFPAWKGLARMGEGWQIGSVITLQSGHPFNVNINFVDDYSGSGQFFDRPDVVGAIRYNRSNPTQFLDVTSFRVPCTLNAAGAGFASDCIAGTRHFGNLGRNALVGPDFRNWDLAIVKTTRITERFKLHFRVDLFNWLNHPNFSNPLLPTFFADAFPNGINPATGRGIGFMPIAATSDVGLGNPITGGGGPRSIQFALKLLF